MSTYHSPGVYVEEISSGSAPIAGVGTSVAAFIGLISLKTDQYKINKVEEEKVGSGDGKKKEFELKNYPVIEDTVVVKVNGDIRSKNPPEKDENDEAANSVDSENPPEKDENNEAANSYKLEDINEKCKIVFTESPSGEITANYYMPSVKKNEIKLCTNFTEFKNYFGDFSPDTDEDKGQNTLAHAVYGFFRNGGTRCYVTWISEAADIDSVLKDFEAIDEITILVAPGNKDLGIKIKEHCEQMGNRVAILDSQKDIDISSVGVVSTLKPFNSNYAALYYPWIQVYDPASKSNIFVPPSGHIAGVYARVDGTRGVHKAPANETIVGALDLKYNLSKAKQGELNPDGINCIRKLNGNIRIWGARTLGGDANGEFKYINIRRQFCYLLDSIDKGTQWTVFEPNDSELWAKIRRNISAFLTNEWRNGALFGTTPQEAFYVKCDAENNPPDVRDLGQVITEIGVAVIKPAEFVIFRLSQWSAS